MTITRVPSCGDCQNYHQTPRGKWICHYYPECKAAVLVAGPKYIGVAHRGNGHCFVRSEATRRNWERWAREVNV